MSSSVCFSVKFLKDKGRLPRNYVFNTSSANMTVSQETTHKTMEGSGYLLNLQKLETLENKLLKGAEHFDSRQA